jgi:hypothetical protein
MTIIDFDLRHAVLFSSSNLCGAAFHGEFVFGNKAAIVNTMSYQTG